MATVGSNTAGYQPKERQGHSSHRIGDLLYVWGGRQSGVHNEQEKTSLTSVVEIFDLKTGEWRKQPTTGDPPLGVGWYASAALNNEIFFFGGYCNNHRCHNTLIKLNIDTFTWNNLSPATAKCGPPMMKYCCGIVALKLDQEDYLCVFGGWGPSSNNTPHQHGAQYNASVFGLVCTNEIHYFNITSGEWMSLTVRGDIPPPCYGFTLTSVTESTAVLFGGDTADGVTNDVYIAEFTKSSVIWKQMSKGQSQWPKKRGGHSAVLITSGTCGPHLLVVGGYHHTNDCWILNINKGIWKELTLPQEVTERLGQSLSAWSMTPSTSWIVIEFGGARRLLGPPVGDTAVIEITYIDTEWSVETHSLDKYQEKLTEWKKK